MTKKSEFGKHRSHGHGRGAGKPRENRFTQLLIQWAKERRPKAAKPRGEMSEEELKTWKAGRNRRRRTRRKAEQTAKAVLRSLGNRKPVENTCRRRRLAAKHPERKGGRK